MTEPEVMEAEVVDEPGTELARVEGSTNLFRTDEPAEVLAKAQATADALMPVVRAKNLISNIQGREHLRVEAWTTLGAMLGVTPVCVWTRMLKNGWEARVEARTLDGRVIGAAEAECLRDESTWAKRDDYALRSMAQTRATSKALASVLRFVATLAGVEGTPAEEMPGTEGRPDGSAAKLASDKQLGFLGKLVADAGSDLETGQRVLINDWAKATLTGGRDGSASKAIEGLKDEPDATLARLLAAAEKWAEAQELPADTRDLPEDPA